MDWEFTLLNYIQTECRTPMLDVLMPFISFLGKLSLIWVLLAGITLCFKKTRSLGRALVCDLLFNLVGGNGILKLIVQRPRPCTLNSTVELLVSRPLDTSFPSGHTMFAFGAAVILFRYHKAYGIAAFLFAGLMAFSRMYLYMHFPTDVLFGAAFGILFALLSLHYEKQLFGSNAGTRPVNALTVPRQEQP